MRKKLVALIGAGLLVTGCSAGATNYESPQSLQSAYNEAGGDCAEATELPESMVSEGAHAMLCSDVTMLIVFDSEEDKNSYLAQTGEVTGEKVTGERWAVLGEKVAQYAGALGGKAS